MIWLIVGLQLDSWAGPPDIHLKQQKKKKKVLKKEILLIKDIIDITLNCNLTFLFVADFLCGESHVGTLISLFQIKIVW